jgi:hypothetical protein
MGKEQIRKRTVPLSQEKAWHFGGVVRKPLKSCIQCTLPKTITST